MIHSAATAYSSDGVRACTRSELYEVYCACEDVMLSVVLGAKYMKCTSELNKALPPTYVCEDVEIEVEDREGEEHGGGGIVDPIRLLQGLEDVANEGLNKGKGFNAIRVYIREGRHRHRNTRVLCRMCVV